MVSVAASEALPTSDLAVGVSFQVLVCLLAVDAVELLSKKFLRSLHQVEVSVVVVQANSMLGVVAAVVDCSRAGRVRKDKKPVHFGACRVQVSVDLPFSSTVLIVEDADEHSMI